MSGGCRLCTRGACYVRSMCPVSTAEDCCDASLAPACVLRVVVGRSGKQAHVRPVVMAPQAAGMPPPSRAGPSRPLAAAAGRGLGGGASHATLHAARPGSKAAAKQLPGPAGAAAKPGAGAGARKAVPAAKPAAPAQQTPPAAAAAPAGQGEEDLDGVMAGEADDVVGSPIMGRRLFQVRLWGPGLSRPLGPACSQAVLTHPVSRCTPASCPLLRQHPAPTVPSRLSLQLCTVLASPLHASPPSRQPRIFLTSFH